MYKFKTTARPFYFSRNNDFVYNIKENFIIKTKFLLEKDQDKKIVASFVLSRKVGSSVQRNKIKRRLRVIFDNLSKSFLYENFAYILIIKKNLVNLPFMILEEEIKKTLCEIFSNRKFIVYLKNSKEKIDNN